jgi:hypothetical protein
LVKSHSLDHNNICCSSSTVSKMWSPSPKSWTRTLSSSSSNGFHHVQEWILMTQLKALSTILFFSFFSHEKNKKKLDTKPSFWLRVIRQNFWVGWPQQ